MELDFLPEVTICPHTSFVQHETDQSKSSLCPESSLVLAKFQKKLMDCNRDLQYQHMISGNRIIWEHIIRQTKELEELIACILIPELLPYLQSFLESGACSYVQLIFHHVLAKLDHPATERFIYSADIFQKNMHSNLKCYFDLYCGDINPQVSFDFIHKVWKYHPCIAFELRLLCCKGLLENKHYDTLNHLIQNNEECFLILDFRLDLRYYAFDLAIEYGAYLTVLLILLCNYVTSRQTAKIETVLMLVQNISPYLQLSPGKERMGCEYFMLLTLRLKQTRLIPSLIKVLLNRPEPFYFVDNSLAILLTLNARLLDISCHKRSMDFIKDNSHYILNVPFILIKKVCHLRYQHCILLLSLLHAYVMSDDLTNMNHVLNRLQEFRQSLLSSTYKSCACFMGKHDCLANKRLLFVNQYIEITSRFKSSSLSLTINDLRNKVIKEELRPVLYLKPMIDAVEKYLDFRKDLIEEFISFIEQISLHNETGLYDIIKTLCDLEMQPEIQDIFIQGLIYYIHEKYNKQYSILSKLLLDTNMTCYKGEFLTKLTINMGQHLLSLDVDTSNDVEKIIYRCFCKVRHENKETDIAKYQVHFTFISTMDAEEKMLKMSNLRSFILMLILLISSGSQHKSAKLKKYLSLKYAYEDAILYLLWCSGDVEINPGPTRTKLEEQAIAIKKRKWIHDMCTITLKLLKNIALDSKSDGMWKEKPDSWQELHADKPFYDPRNKQKSKQFIKNDEELLNCLLKFCDWKSITLPSNFQREIDAWRSDIVLLLELFDTRREIDAMKKEKELLIMYKDTAELKQHLKDCNICISFNPNHVGNSKGYSDIVRKLAITFCRISKGLPILVKKDGIWKTQPHDWNPNDLYYDPSNTGKRQEKHQDQKLVDSLLFYCERKSISIPSELQLVVKAWKLGNSQEVCKHYTIWSCMAVIQHSLKYLELEGLLEKTHVQQSLKQIGVSLHCEKSPKKLNNDSTINTDNESKVSGLPNNSLSDNQRGTDSNSPSSSASDSDIVCSQHPYEAKALTNSQTMKSVIKCSKHDFQNHPSTSGCTIYYTIVPCPDNRGDLQYTDERLDIPDRHKSVSEILCKEPDFQLSSSGCSSFTKRAQCLKVSDDLPSKDGRIQKRKRAISEERSEKRSGLHLGNESQAYTSSITRCNGVTSPSSHCDLDIAGQHVESTEEDMDQGLSSNRIPVPDNKQDTDSTKDQLFGLEDEIPQRLEEIIDSYIIMSRDNLEEDLEENLEENLGEDLEHIDRQLKLWETV